jgi:hypothetical protein
MSRPEFSIVVPTRNRSAQLAGTLVPLTRQRVRDVEIIVSDNSDDDQAAQNAALVEGLRSDFEIRLVRPPKILNMTDHWNFALGLPQGRFVGIVTDRMTLLPSTLEAALAELQGNVACVSFSHTTLRRESDGLRVTPAMAEPRVERMVSRDVLKRFAGGGATKACPRLLNCFVDADVLGRMKAEAGQALLGISPDYSFLFNYLARYESYTHLHRQYLVDHAPQVSNGMAATQNRPNAALRDFSARMVAEQGDTLALRPMPDDNFFFPNLVLAEYALAGLTTPNSDLPELDHAGIYAACWRQAKGAASHGNAQSDHALSMLEAYRTAHGIAAPGLRKRLSMAWRKRRNRMKQLRIQRRAVAPPAESFDVAQELRRGHKIADALQVIDR